MAQTYLYGYGNDTIGYGPYGATPTRRDKGYILTQTQFKLVDPEIMRRLFALADAVIRAGSDYGFGGGGRTSLQQLNLFLSRYTKVAPGQPYTLYWNGLPTYPSRAGYYLHTSGATAAPPGRSYHEQTTKNGTGNALAVDMVGNHAIGGDIRAAFGLVDFSNVNNEPWHYQGVEYPHSRSEYNGEFEAPAPVWPIPGIDPPPPTPVPGDDMKTHKPKRVYDSRGDGLTPFKAGESRLIPVVYGAEASLAGSVQALPGSPAGGFWSYNTEDKWDDPSLTSFANPASDGNWHNWGSIPVLAINPQGHIWVYSKYGGHIFIDRYASDTGV